MVFLENWQFFHLFNIGKKSKENEFKNILQSKKLFQTIRATSYKVEKLGFF